jgi:hypothetical protein
MTDLPKTDVTGQKHGRLTAIKFSHWTRYPSGNRSQFWQFKCDCGTVKVINVAYVRSGSTKSCGCLVRKKSNE